MTDFYRMKNTLASKQAIKGMAQNALMHAMMNAFYALEDEKASEEVVAEARRQVNRVERLFGYEVNSWKA